RACAPNLRCHGDRHRSAGDWTGHHLGCHPPARRRASAGLVMAAGRPDHLRATAPGGRESRSCRVHRPPVGAGLAGLVMSDDDVVGRVLKVGAAIAGTGRTPAEAGAGAALQEGRFWLDSVGLLETVLACEEEFVANLDRETDLADGGLLTVGSLAAAIARKLGASS